VKIGHISTEALKSELQKRERREQAEEALRLIEESVKGDGGRSLNLDIAMPPRLWRALLAEVQLKESDDA
jgi:hypothetical protein